MRSIKLRGKQRSNLWVAIVAASARRDFLKITKLDQGLTPSASTASVATALSNVDDNFGRTDDQLCISGPFSNRTVATLIINFYVSQVLPGFSLHLRTSIGRCGIVIIALLATTHATATMLELVSSGPQSLSINTFICTTVSSDVFNRQSCRNITLVSSFI